MTKKEKKELLQVLKELMEAYKSMARSELETFTNTEPERGSEAYVKAEALLEKYNAE